MRQIVVVLLFVSCTEPNIKFLPESGSTSASSSTTVLETTSAPTSSAGVTSSDPSTTLTSGLVTEETDTSDVEFTSTDVSSGSTAVVNPACDPLDTLDPFFMVTKVNLQEYPLTQVECTGLESKVLGARYTSDGSALVFTPDDTCPQGSKPPFTLKLHHDGFSPPQNLFGLDTCVTLAVTTHPYENGKCFIKTLDIWDIMGPIALGEFGTVPNLLFPPFALEPSSPCGCDDCCFPTHPGHYIFTIEGTPVPETNPPAMLEYMGLTFLNLRSHVHGECADLDMPMHKTIHIDYFLSLLN